MREMGPERTQRMTTKQAKKMLISQRHWLSKGGIPDYFHTEDNQASLIATVPLKNS